MRSLSLLTALMALAFVMPARAADWDRAGDVAFGPSYERDVAFAEFAGPVGELRFTASGSSAECRTINALLSNGNERVLFTGLLDRDVNTVISLTADERNIVRLTFVCRSMSDRINSSILIDAQYGDYDIPFPADRDEALWVQLGTAEFAPEADLERVFTGFQGRSVDRIGIRPLDNEAQCRRVVVDFKTGPGRDVQIVGRLTRDRTYVADLPGNQRNIEGVGLICRGLNDRPVTIGIFARK